jgi:AraC-like DNA-binding protein
MDRPQQSCVYYNSHPSRYFSIVEGGYIHNSGGIPRFGSRILDCPALVYLVEGRGTYETSPGEIRPIRKGMLFLVSPKRPHAYGPLPGEYWHEAYIVMDGDWVALLLKHGLLPDEKTDWFANPTTYWLNRWLGLMDKDHLPSAKRNRREAARFHQFITDLKTHQTTHQQGEATADWLTRVENQLRASLRTKADYAAIARTMGMSYDHFRKSFARVTGVSPARYRAILQMNEAASWLLQPGATVQAAADHFGFCDPFHFSKRFKHIHRTSPKAFLARRYRRL